MEQQLVFLLELNNTPEQGKALDPEIGKRARVWGGGGKQSEGANIPKKSPMKLASVHVPI